MEYVEVSSVTYLCRTPNQSMYLRAPTATSPTLLRAMCGMTILTNRTSDISKRAKHPEIAHTIPPVLPTSLVKPVSYWPRQLRESRTCPHHAEPDTPPKESYAPHLVIASLSVPRFREIQHS